MERFDRSRSPGGERGAHADAALMALHDMLAARCAPKPGSFSTLDGEALRAYNREAKRRSRERMRGAEQSGRTPPTATNVRTALADAALMLLATDGPGADQVRTVLATVFAARPGVLLTIEQRARSGRLRPKLLRRN